MRKEDLRKCFTQRVFSLRDSNGAGPEIACQRIYFSYLLCYMIFQSIRSSFCRLRLYRLFKRNELNGIKGDVY